MTIKYYEPLKGMSACACMGPMYGEPHCACTMSRMGLPMSDEHVAEQAAAKVRLSRVDWARVFKNTGIPNEPV